MLSRDVSTWQASLSVGVWYMVTPEVVGVSASCQPVSVVSISLLVDPLFIFLRQDAGWYRVIPSEKTAASLPVLRHRLEVAHGDWPNVEATHQVVVM